MFQDLVAKYGPESLPPATATGATATAPLTVSSGGAAAAWPDHRTRLVAFYQKYAPEKVKRVDDALQAYQGDEEAMFAELVRKYGPEPAPPLPTASPRSMNAPTAAAWPNARARLIGFFTRYCPDKLSTVDSILNAYAKDEAELFRRLTAEYGPEPSPGDPLAQVQPAVMPRDRLIAFYGHYCPEKVSTVDRVLEAYKGDEEALFGELVAKYGPEPKSLVGSSLAGGEAAATGPSAGSSSANNTGILHPRSLAPPYDRPERRMATDGSAENVDIRRRLVIFFRRYAPERLPFVDELMDANRGKFDSMFDQIVKKYGPEPLGAVVTSKDFPPGLFSDIVAKLKDGLTRFFTAVDPPQLSQVDALVATFVDDQIRLRSAMSAKYGADVLERYCRLPIPGSVEYSDAGCHPADQSYSAPYTDNLPQHASGDGSSSPTRGTAEFKRLLQERVRKFYLRFCPDKLSEIPSILLKWGYDEKSLFAHLYERYRVGADDRIYHMAQPMTLSEALAASSISFRSSKQQMELESETKRQAANCILPRAESGRCITGSGRLTLWVRAVHGINVQRSVRRSQRGFRVSVGYPVAEVFRTTLCAKEDEPQWKEKEGQTVIPLRKAPASTASASSTGSAVDEHRMRFQLLDADDQCWATAEIPIDRMLPIGEASLDWQAPSLRVANRLAVFDAGGSYETGGYVKLLWSFAPDLQLPGMGNSNSANASSSRSAPAPTIGVDEVGGVPPILARLRGYFARYIPERLGDVGDIAAQYAGRELDLLDCFVVRFGPEPDPYEFRSRVERLFCIYDPKRVKEAGVVATQSVGHEDFVIKSLTKKYGPEPGVGYTVPSVGDQAPNPSTCPFRVRLTRWLTLHAARRVREVDYLLNRFARREAVLFRLLGQTLGPEPKDEEPKENLRSRFRSTPALAAFFAKRRAPPFLNWLWTTKTEDELEAHSNFDSEYKKHYRRLEAFHRHYNPYKIQEVEETLQRWKGKEDLLFEALVHKYGSEPAAIAPARDSHHGVGAFPLSNNTGGPSSASSPLTSYIGLAGNMQREDEATLARNKQLETYSHQNTPRATLQAFYAIHNASKLSEVDDVLERFEGREEALYHMLHMKYGIDPTLMPKNLGKKVGSVAARRPLVASPNGALMSSRTTTLDDDQAIRDDVQLALKTATTAIQLPHRAHRRLVSPPGLEEWRGSSNASMSSPARRAADASAESDYSAV